MILVLMERKFRIILYIFVIVLLCLLRYTLDKDSIFVTSDGQIKLYQAIQYKYSGMFSTDCYYPAKDIDLNYEYFPFEYPWTRLKNKTCIFQYPMFFSYMGTIVMNIFGTPLSVMYISIFFQFLCLLVFDQILSTLNIQKLYILFSTIITFILSFPILTIIDFSEMSLFHFLVLLGLYVSLLIYKKIDNDSDGRGFYSLIFIQGIFFGSAFLFRGEIILLSGIFYLLNLIIFRKYFFTIYSISSLSIGLLIPIIFYGVFHFLQMGNPLGYRLLSLIDNSKHTMGFRQHIEIAIGYLYGNKIMIGLFKAFPGIVFAFVAIIPVIYKNIPKGILVFFYSAVSYILIAAFSVTVYGGVGFFGLRYLEIGFILLMIVITYIFSYSFRNTPNSFIEIMDRYIPFKLVKRLLIKNFKWIFLLILFLSVLQPIRFIRGGIQHLLKASGFYHELQRKFSKVGENGYVLHTSYNTSYLIGYSFLKQKHLTPYRLKDFWKIEKLLYEKGEKKFMVVNTPNDHYVSADIPKSIYIKFKNKYQIKPKYYKIIHKESFLEYELYTLERK